MQELDEDDDEDYESKSEFKLSDEDLQHLEDLFNTANIEEKRNSHCCKRSGVDILGNAMHLPIQVRVIFV